MIGMRGGFSRGDNNVAFAWHYTEYGVLATNCYANGVTVECVIRPRNCDDPYYKEMRYEIDMRIKPDDEQWEIHAVVDSPFEAIDWAEQMIYHVISHHKPGQRENVEGYPVIQPETKPRAVSTGDPTEGLGY